MLTQARALCPKALGPSEGEAESLLWHEASPDHAPAALSSPPEAPVLAGALTQGQGSPGMPHASVGLGNRRAGLPEIPAPCCRLVTLDKSFHFCESGAQGSHQKMRITIPALLGRPLRRRLEA